MQLSDRHFKHWNYTTSCCFKYKAHCELCPNVIICEQIKNYSTNEYNIHPAKYAMLRTYAVSEDDYKKGFSSFGRQKQTLVEAVTNPIIKRPKRILKKQKELWLDFWNELLTTSPEQFAAGYKDLKPEIQAELHSFFYENDQKLYKRMLDIIPKTEE